MMLWVIFAALAILTALSLAVPLLRRAEQPAARSAFDLHVYRQQLAELERDRERGVLPDDQADAARAEIHRRMLAAEEGETGAAPARRRHLALAVLLGLGVPVAAGLIYWHLGAPDLPGKPFASRQSDPAFRMAALARTLSARLAASPDGEGFRQLGHVYVALERYPEAIEAFRKADQLGGADSPMLSAWGEAETINAGGMVIPEARQLFLRALAQDAGNPQARFYLGIAESEIGNYRKAVAIWKDLEKSSAADAPWRDQVRQEIVQAARQGGFDPASVEPAPPVVPTGDQAAAIAGAPPDQQAAAIRAMVAGLAARMEKQPDDFDGWMRLALSYRVLGETAKGEEAARRAIALRPKAVEPRLALARLQLGNAPETALPADFLATLRDLRAIDPDNGTALYYLGAAAAAAGRPGEARKDWQRLLDRMPAGRPERADIERRLKALKQG